MLSKLGKLFDTNPRLRRDVSDTVADAVCADYASSATYQTLYEISASLTARPSLGLLTPSAGVEFGSRPDQLKQVLGDPELNLYTPREHLLFYRITAGGYKMRCEFHFHKSCLFYARRTFSRVNMLEADEVFSAIRARYLQDGPFDPEREKIVDIQGNELFARDGDELQISYLRAHNASFNSIYAGV